MLLIVEDGGGFVKSLRVLCRQTCRCYKKERYFVRFPRQTCRWWKG